MAGRKRRPWARRMAERPMAPARLHSSAGRGTICRAAAPLKRGNKMSDEPVRQEQEEPISENRRQAMKKLGKYGLYTAPALLAVLDAALLVLW